MNKLDLMRFKAVMSHVSSGVYFDQKQVIYVNFSDFTTNFKGITEI